MVQHLLHGMLHVTVYEVDRLEIEEPMPKVFQKETIVSQRSTKRLFSKFNKSVLWRPRIGGSKLYTTIDLGKDKVGQTRLLENEHFNPRWYESFHIYCAHVVSDVIFAVKDDIAGVGMIIGRAYVPVEEIINEYEIDKWVEILDEDHKPIHGGSKIHIKLQFFDVTRDSNWSQGIKSPEFKGVPHTFFKQRNGCRVSLYQDAHIEDYFNPKILLPGGKYYEHHRCWEDIFDAITNAKHLIYISAWSIYSKITLIRDSRRQKPDGDITLGELLKKKANEGLKVVILVWDKIISVEALKKYALAAIPVKTLKTYGLAENHCKDTRDYFQNTNVHCVLFSRSPGDSKSIVQGFPIPLIFSHHQKIVVVDKEVPGEKSQKRRIVSFLGGIDLCNGRYDTQYHSLFRTLDMTHRDDFHQPSCPGSSIIKGGPRQPWHDIHCQLEGPVAWDVMYNFEQILKMKEGSENLFPVSELDEIITNPSPNMSSEDQETWNVQLFRSISAGDAHGFPNKPKEAAEAGLVRWKGTIIDRSIQDAYINAIRRAKNFIYIESQFFLGSSFSWKPNDIKVENIGASHLIPKELSLKIVSKIKAGERFMVYIVIPMWPEGDPEKNHVQAILDWQRRTMEMMYSDISCALQAEGLNENPREYLAFFCLGNREEEQLAEPTPLVKPERNTNYSRAQLARRFMIYVHSKMMIVDDEYIIIGSANINQRSMDGARDSEIAMGGYQPCHLLTEQPARGEIHGFRMSLWYEHLGSIKNSFLHPESVECVRQVHEIADKNWDLYSSKTVEHDLPCHLLRYPIQVTNSGKVTTLPETEYFPDTKARVLGTKCSFPFPILTT